MSVEKFLNKKLLKEGNEVMHGYDGSLADDEVEVFWVVTRPKVFKGEKTPSSELADICFPSTVLGMVNQVRGGLDDNGQIYGIYKTEAKAKKVAEKLLKSTDENDFYYER